MLTFECNKCHHKIMIPETVNNKVGRCPKCNSELFFSTPETLPKKKDSVDVVSVGERHLSHHEKLADEYRHPCVFCGKLIMDSTIKCPFCGGSQFNDRPQQSLVNIYQQPQHFVPSDDAGSSKATGSFVCALVGLIFFGLILGIIAVVLGTAANNQAQRMGRPRWGLATAGVVIGIIDIVLGAILLLFFF